MLDKSFLGKGVSLSFDIDKNGAIRYSSLQESVKESMLIILSTKVGERVMNYDFGCEIHELMFELNTPSTHSSARAYVAKALKRWEPRVVIRDIKVESIRKNELLIDIEYHIIEANIDDNLVYPFYLN